MRLQQKFIKASGLSDGWHERHYEILAEGMPTPITRVYWIFGEELGGQNELRFGEEKFDMTAEGTNGWEEWILARLNPHGFNMEHNEEKTY